MYRYLALFLILAATKTTYANDCLKLEEQECHKNSSCIPINYRSCCGSEEFGCFEGSLEKCKYDVHCYRSSKSLDIIEASNDCFVPPVGYELFEPINKCTDEKIKECSDKGKQCLFKKNDCGNPTSCCPGTSYCEGDLLDSGSSSAPAASSASDTDKNETSTRIIDRELADLCDNVICQVNETCKVGPDGRAYCYVDLCLNVVCQPNQHCEITQDGNAHCVLDINPIGFTTTGVSSTVAGSSSTTGGGIPSTSGGVGDICANVQCPPGYYCVNMDDGFAQCFKGDPTSTSTTFGSTTGSDVCVNVVCPVGYHCIRTNEGKARCVRDTPSTTGNACSNVQCPPGYHCEVSRNGNAICVYDGPITTMSSTTGNACSNINCGPGYICIVNSQNRPVCIYIGGTTSSSTTGGNVCRNIVCPSGYHCESRNGIPICVPDSPSTSTTGVDVCQGYVCPVNYRCQSYNGNPRCVYDGSSTGGNLCNNVPNLCPDGYHCIIGSDGKPTCAPDPTSTSTTGSSTSSVCNNFICPVNYHCEPDRYNRPICVSDITPL